MAAPRWKNIIEKALSKNPKQTAFQLASLDADAGRFDAEIIPRVRSHLYRSFLSSPESPSLPLIISSTDVRSAKVTQVTQTSTKCELVWWLETTIQQVRIICDVYVVPSPNNPQSSKFQQALHDAQAGTGLAAVKGKDWEAHRVELFRSMSSRMKATWCRPAPGSKLQGGQDEAKKWPAEIHDPDEGPDKDSEEYNEAKRLWDMALGNFATIVVDPLEVDFIDLGVFPNVRFIFRKKFREGQSGNWEEEELVP